MIVDYYEDWCTSRIPSAKTRRAKQLAAKRYRLPIIRLGNSTVIDDEAGDARLREMALFQDTPQRRGRPRALNLKSA